MITNKGTVGLLITLLVALGILGAVISYEQSKQPVITPLSPIASTTIEGSPTSPTLPPVTTSSTLTITSPVGGERWAKGETHTITWTYPVSYQGSFDLFIQTIPAPISCFKAPCPQPATPAPTLLAAAVSGASHAWTIGGTGFYKVGVCYSGTKTCSWSNNVTVSTEPVAPDTTMMCREALHAADYQKYDINCPAHYQCVVPSAKSCTSFYCIGSCKPGEPYTR